jgi:hypothetical protein
MNAAVQHVEQPFEGGPPYAGKSFREDVRAQRHRRADRARWQRLADPGRVAAQQIQLERAKSLARDGRLRERAEAGIDAVDRCVAGGFAVHDSPRSIHAARGLRRKRHLLIAVGDGEKLADGKRRAVEQNHCGLRIVDCRLRSTDCRLLIDRRLAIAD